MTLVLGVGQGGCNVVAEMARVPGARDFLDTYLINSTMRDLVPIKDVPRQRWIGVHETQGLVAYRPGIEKELTGGMGKDPHRCFTTLTSVFDSVLAALGSVAAGGKGFAQERFALVVFSGAGGTGSGAAPVVARALRELTNGACRVLGVIILPAQSRGGEADVGSRREAWNAWYSLQRSLEVFDGIAVVDNERLAHLGDVERAFPRFNQYVARCLTDMVLGNLTELVLPGEDEVVVQQSDVMDLTTAMSIGAPGERRPGIAAVGRAVELLQGPLHYLLPVFPYRNPDFVTLAHLARERLTMREDGAGSCEKAYLLVRAPSRVLGRAGTGQDVSEVLNVIGRESRRGEVVYGTALTKRPLASLTLGLTWDPATHPRLKALESEASQYDEEAGRSAG